jgi:hypothetical protein
MKIIITERQLKLISEQSMQGWGNYVPKGKHMEVVKGWDSVLSGHDMNTILGIGTLLIPVVGPFLSSLIGIGDGLKHIQEKHNLQGSLILIFSALPLSLKVLGLIPELNQIGTRGAAAIAEKILSGSKLSSVESKVIQKLVTNKEVISDEVKIMTNLLKPVESTISKYGANYVKRFGQQKYQLLISNFLAQKITKDQFDKEISKAQ